MKRYDIKISFSGKCLNPFDRDCRLVSRKKNDTLFYEASESEDEDDTIPSLESIPSLAHFL